ncbi:MAG: terpene synthase family protein [Aggregatilineales bacterium]
MILPAAAPITIKPEDLNTLSDLIAISEKRQHPLAAQAEQQIEALCRKYGVLQHHLNQYTTMSGFMYPASPVDRLVASGLLFNTLIYIDDMHERAERTEGDDAAQEKIQIALRTKFETAINVLLTGQKPEESYFLYDVALYLHRAFAPHADGKWLPRIAKSLVDHLRVVTYDNSNVITAGKLDVGKYIDVRLLDAGMDPTMDMVEFTSNIYLPDELLQDKHIADMRNLCARIGALMNDIFSYEKEVLWGETRWNLLVGYMESYEMDFAHALHYSIEHVNDATQAFKTLKMNMPVYGNTEVQSAVEEYVTGLENIISATWHWQIRTNRYRSITSPYPELRSLLPETLVEL